MITYDDRRAYALRTLLLAIDDLHVDRMHNENDLIVAMKDYGRRSTLAYKEAEEAVRFARRHLRLKITDTRTNK